MREPFTTVGTPVPLFLCMCFFVGSVITRILSFVDTTFVLTSYPFRIMSFFMFSEITLTGVTTSTVALNAHKLLRWVMT